LATEALGDSFEYYRRYINRFIYLSIYLRRHGDCSVRRVSCRVRVSSLWFDDESRTVKRALRLSERAARRAGLLSDASSAAAASYRSQRHRYVTLLRQKESAFWSERIDAQQSQPCQLWRSFDKLLG